jgi:predicted PurR-regulated permease PerM
VSASLPLTDLGGIGPSSVGRAVAVISAPATGAALAAEILGAIALALFLVFFLLKDADTMWRWTLTRVPPATSPAGRPGGTRGLGRPDRVRARHRHHRGG